MAQYYSGKNLFMTGATGFCGKPIIEKLLRACPDIQGIYCLTRPKKGTNPQERLREIFNDPVSTNLSPIYCTEPRILDLTIRIWHRKYFMGEEHTEHNPWASRPYEHFFY